MGKTKVKVDVKADAGHKSECQNAELVVFDNVFAISEETALGGLGAFFLWPIVIGIGILIFTRICLRR